MTAEAGRSTVYETEIVEIGDNVGEFLDEGVLVLFGRDAPAELREYAIIHEPVHANGPVESGCIVLIDDERLEVLAVGHAANDNLQELGHLVLKRNGQTEPPLPGDVCCDEGDLPLLVPGTVLRILAPSGSA